MNIDSLGMLMDDPSVIWQIITPRNAPAECAKGIWSTRIDPHLNSSLKEVLFQDRRDHCFFIEANKGMSFEAASELHRLRNDNRQLKQSYRYTQIGLWIAATGVVASVIMRVLEKLGWIPQ